MERAISVLQDKKFLFLLAVFLALITYRLFLRLMPKKNSYEELYNEIITYDKYKVRGKFE